MWRMFGLAVLQVSFPAKKQEIQKQGMFTKLVCVCVCVLWFALNTCRRRGEGITQILMTWTKVILTVLKRSVISIYK